MRLLYSTSTNINLVLANRTGTNSRYQLAIYQCGIRLGIILAKYTQSWVQYIQDGKNTVIPTEDLKEEEMLVLHVLHDFELGDTDGGYKYSTLIRAIEEKETARLVV